MSTCRWLTGSPSIVQNILDDESRHAMPLIAVQTCRKGDLAITSSNLPLNDSYILSQTTHYSVDVSSFSIMTNLLREWIEKALLNKITA